MNNPNFDELVNSIGAMCEMSALMRDSLIANGFTRGEACKIVMNYLIAVLTMPNGGGKGG